MRHPGAWAVFLLLAGGCGGAGGAEEGDVAIFAAASLRNVMEDLRPALREATGREPIYNFAGSNVLAQQIEAALGADVFLSANERWVDFLQQADRLVSGARRVFASNHLVVVTHRDSELSMESPRDLASPTVRFLSLGNPSAVPAGVYAMGFLEGAQLSGGDTLWEALQDRVAPAPDVRAALGMVEARTDVAGIVYATDVRQSTRVKVLYEVPPESAPPIRYVAAAVRGGPAGENVARAVLEVLSSAEGLEVLQRHGFRVPEGAESGSR